MLNASDSAQEEEEYYDEDEFGPEALIIWESPVRGVVFSHKTHTYEMGLSCEDCHDEIFEMEAGYAETEDDFNMEAMYEGKYCGACHDGDMAFAANTRCTTCHIGVRGVARLTGESEESSHH